MGADSELVCQRVSLGLDPLRGKSLITLSSVSLSYNFGWFPTQRLWGLVFLVLELRGGEPSIGPGPLTPQLGQVALQITLILDYHM